MVKVSIIVPIYKVEKYIERCLRSVIAQTYEGPLECILVDDCTPDGSMEIVEQVLAGYSGNICFKVVRHERNSGLSAARNTGVENATGEYLYFLDSDDEITPDAMELFIALSEQYPQAEIIQGNLYTTYNMKFLLIPDSIPEYINEARKLRKMLLKGSVLPVTAWNKMIRKDFLEQNSLWFEEGIVHEDYLWNFLIAQCISSMAVCYKPTYVYYWNEGSIMGCVSIHRVESILRILKVIFSYITKKQTIYQYRSAIQLACTLLSMLLEFQDYSYINEKISIVKKMFGKVCKKTFFEISWGSFLLLSLFYGGVTIYKYCWPFLKRKRIM